MVADREGGEYQGGVNPTHRRHPEVLVAKRRASKDGHKGGARRDPSRRRASARLLRGWPKKSEVIPVLCDSFGFARFEGGHDVLD